MLDNNFDVSKYDNPVAQAVKKIGSIKKAARKLNVEDYVVMHWIRSGYVRSRMSALILEDKTGSYPPSFDLGDFLSFTSSFQNIRN
jgi:hypothetical protein